MINFTVTEKKINEYSQAQPFPHTVIDNFLPPSLLNGVIDDFRNYNNWGWDNSNYSKDHQIKKFFSPWNNDGDTALPINTKLILNYFNSSDFISTLEKLTGIKGLISDPTLLGGGMHKIDSGGKLSIHADSRKHAVTGNYRRINLLLYLNKGWNKEWGGSLQLWDKDMTTMVRDIQPLFNRVVIFNTGADTYHGHPHPLNTPNGMSRISLALYYYTKENPDIEETSVTSAVWKDVPIKVKQNGPAMCFATMCKNEEHCIKDTLESVYRYIDYWVVCDTGSTDRTKEIVKEFFLDKGIPGELIEHEWTGFDHNKSLMMEAAFNKTDYVMHLDADDLLMGDFSFTKEDVGSDLYFMKVKRGNLEWKAYIIFNNRLRWKFCGVAHTILKCLDGNDPIISDISDREAYVSGEERGSRKFDPNKYFIDAEKLKKQFFDTLLDDPYDLNRRSVFYTAQSYMDCGMYHDAIKWNRLYLNLKNTWDEERFEAQMRVSLCMISLKSDTQSILEEMEKAMKIFPDRVEPIYHLGKYLVEMGEHEKAYNYLLKGTKLEFSSVKDKYILFLNENCYGKNLYDDLSVSCFWTRRYTEGLNYLNQIIDLPSFAHYKERLLLNAQHFKNAMKL